VEEDGASSTRQSWMQTSSLWPMQSRSKSRSARVSFYIQCMMLSEGQLMHIVVYVGGRLLS